MKNRYPKLIYRDGKPICRGCGGSIPKGRQTWCSAKCYDDFCPQRVIYFVKQRDKGICQLCGIDTKAETKAWEQRKPQAPRYHDVWNKWPYDIQGFQNTPEYIAFRKALKTWKAESPKPEYDHIKPFSEGGPTTLENMRTLCAKCHRTRTHDWHSKRRTISGVMSNS